MRAKYWERSGGLLRSHLLPCLTRPYFAAIRAYSRLAMFMRCFVFSLLFLFPQGLFGQGVQYVYSADHSKFYFVGANRDSILICDLNACTYYRQANTFFFLTKAESEFESGQPCCPGMIQYEWYHDSVVRQLLAKCKDHRLVIKNGDFTSVVEGKGNDLQSGHYEKYFRDTLVVKGEFRAGKPYGFLIFYKYSLHPRFSIFYFPDAAGVYYHNFMEYAISLWSIIIMALLFTFGIIAVLKKWYLLYPRYRRQVYYSMLAVNAVYNIMLHAGKVGLAVSILYSFRMVWQHVYLQALIGGLSLSASLVNIFLPGGSRSIRVVSIMVLVFNILFFFFYREIKDTHLSFG